MRSTLTVLAIATVLVTGSFTVRVSGSTGPIPLNCDRACLEGLIDQYLAAVVAHDPSKLPLSKDVKYSENYQMLQVGDGFWKTASGIGSYKHVFADPEFGQVAMMGTMREANTTLLMSVRLRVELGRITEIESDATSNLVVADRTTSRAWTRAARLRTSGSGRFRRRSACRVSN